MRKRIGKKDCGAERQKYSDGDGGDALIQHMAAAVFHERDKLSVSFSARCPRLLL